VVCAEALTRSSGDYGSLETAVRIGGWCELAASLGVSCETGAFQQVREHGS
jgi:hypothetical protein